MRRRILLNDSSWIDPTTGRGVIDGYEVVDLGLRSGLLLATWNVGASSETDYGDYYMYGKGAQKYNSDDDRLYTGNENPLASSADTATQVMGEGWRMITSEELGDLVYRTNYTWVSINGINGGKFTSKRNPNAYVFFPAAGLNGGSFVGGYGFVWSSTPHNDGSAFHLTFNNEKAIEWDNHARIMGYSVRGVHAAV